MKKKNKIQLVKSNGLALLCAACLLMIGCEQKTPQSDSYKQSDEETEKPEEKSQPTVYCSPQAIKAPFGGGEYSILLNATSQWTASCNRDWVHIDNQSGQGTSYVKIDLDWGLQDSANVIFSTGTESTILKIVRNQELKETGKHNGHGYVDLGYKYKWATCNIGANSPEKCGDYFAWGETSTKSDYSLQTYKFFGFECEYNIVFTKYTHNSYCGSNVDSRCELDDSDDAAVVNWGGNWHMPIDVGEIEYPCNVISTTYKGNSGILVISDKKGYEDACIFIPYSGYYEGTTKVDAQCCFWTAAQQYTRTGKAYPYYYSTFRELGMPIRAVFE